MLIQLPVETWIEILDWLRRRDLIKKLDKLWDRELTPIVQDWLHKYTRNVQIGELWTAPDGLSVVSCKRLLEKAPIAEVEMPRNITSFERIALRYLDSTLLAFLHRMSPLFHNIHLWIDDDYRQAADELPMRTALRALMPMISGGSIETLTLDCKFLAFFSANYPSTLSNVKLLQIWYLQASAWQILVDWLFTKRDDGHVRMLIFENSSSEDLFCEQIRERFMHADRQCACSPFFVQYMIGYVEAAITNTIENGRTGELLTYKTVEHRSWDYQLVSNCPINVDEEWLTKKEEEVLKWDVRNEHQVIELNSLEISPLLYAADDAEQQQKAIIGSGSKLT